MADAVGNALSGLSGSPSGQEALASEALAGAMDLVLDVKCVAEAPGVMATSTVSGEALSLKDGVFHVQGERN